MSSVNDKQKACLGFLTVIEHPQQGLCGGYLLLNHSGRPLEFHCTVPVKASRAQEILYGPTLTPFLYGEQIGLTLLSKSKAQPRLVCTDCEPVLAVQELTPIPVALVCTSEEGAVGAATSEASGGVVRRCDAGHKHGAPHYTYQVGRNRLTFAGPAEADCAALVKDAAALIESFDLVEPFSRIREAIEEAQKAAR